METSVKNIRPRFIRDIVLAIVVMVGLILGFFAFQEWRIRSDVAQSYIARVSSLALAEFEQFYRPVEDALAIAQKWGMEGGLELSGIEALNIKFMPIMEQIPAISGVAVADDEGGEYFLSRADGGWLTRSRPAGKGSVSVSWSQWSGARQRVREWTETIEYDPRERPWYRAAVANRGDRRTVWSEPYRFFTQNRPGVTAAREWRSEGREKAAVVAFDVLLDEVLDRVAALKVSPHGETFLADDDGRIFQRPESGEWTGARNSLFRDPEEAGLPVIARAITAWTREGRLADQPVSFVASRSSYWAVFHHLNVGDWRLWIGSVAPQKDFLEGLPLGGWDLMAAGMVFLAAGGAAAFWLVRKYQHRLRDLSREEVSAANFETIVRRLIEQGEGDSLEFKSTMRMNLRTGKHGKEVEVAWLKAVAAFMNTDGGSLLLGVDDTGGIVGLEADGFENDDRCHLHFKNVLGQHIGLEFSELLKFHLGTIEGKKVALVECTRSRNPVFVTANNDEGFYVRSGPSSVALPVSKALKYLEQRE